ncbi:unnamed protein product, partial [Polarella glacialis]
LIKQERVDSWGDSNFHELYVIGKVLGSGTRSTVRRAKRRSDGYEVAVKCGHDGNDDELRNFSRTEYELMKSLQHRSILRAEEMHELPSGIWVVMELCEDGCMDSYVTQSSPFLEEESHSLAMQLLQSVSYLHSKRIVHRDLKPANLLLKNGASLLKVSDFNSAKKIGRSEGSSVMLTDRGTSLFSAPELRFQRSWNEQVDVWACGHCLFFMTQGDLAFDIGEPSVKHALLSGAMPDIDWKVFVSILWKNLTMQCLTPDPKQRPPILELLVHPVFEQLQSQYKSHVCRSVPDIQ